MKTLFIDACPRTHSRTRKLAQVLLQKISGELEHLVLANEQFPDLDEQGIIHRTEDCRTGNFSDAKYEYAKRFADDSIDFSKYDEQINAWYEIALTDENEEIKHHAADSLFGFYLRNNITKNS